MPIKNWFYLRKDAPGLKKETIETPSDTYVNIVDVDSPNSGNIMSVSDFAAKSRPYKVYTALLTQSGGDSASWYESFDNGSLLTGWSVQISDYQLGDDFTNIGAPNNANGVSFVINGNTAASWTGSTRLNYNTGAPVVTVLENTIGNVWFGYEATGFYSINSDSLFTNSKSWTIPVIVLGTGGPAYRGSVNINDSNMIGIVTELDVDTSSDGLLYNTPIEIRVYN